MRRHLPVALAAALALSAMTMAGCGFRPFEEPSSGQAEGKAPTQVLALDGSYSAIDLRTDFADIEIRSGETASCEVYMDKWYHMEQTVRDNTLYLSEKDSEPFWKKIFHFSSFRNRIVMTLPQDFTDTLTVESDTGDVVISGLDTDQLTVRADTGDVQMSGLRSAGMTVKNDSGAVSLENCTAHSIEAKTDTGKLVLTDCTAESMDVQSDTGNIRMAGLRTGQIGLQNDTGDTKIQLSTGADVSAQLDTGDFSLTLPGREADYNYDLVNMTGNTVIGSDHAGRSELTYVVDNHAQSTVKVRNDTGDIKILFSDQTEEGMRE